MKPELKLCGLLADGDDVDTEKARHPGPEHHDGACRWKGAGTGAFRRAWDSGNRCSREPLEAAMIISRNSTTCSEGPVSGDSLGSLRGYDDGGPLKQSIALTEGLRDGDGPADCAWWRLEADEMDGRGRRGALLIASTRPQLLSGLHNY